MKKKPSGAPKKKVPRGEIAELAKAVAAFRDARDWKQFHNPKDCAVSLSLEASELLEQFQWKDPEEVRRHVEEKLDKVSEELMDVLYWVLLMSGDLGIDVRAAFLAKLQQNEAKYPVAKAKGKHTKYTDL